MEQIGTGETHGIPCGVGGDKPLRNGKESPMMSWESDQFIVARKPRHGGGAKGLAVRPRSQRDIPQAPNWVWDGHETGPITSVRLREVWLKSRMRARGTSGSVRGFIMDSFRRWL
jgi:hypothetical protein